MNVYEAAMSDQRNYDKSTEYYYQGVKEMKNENYSAAVESFKISDMYYTHFKTHERLYQCYIKLGLEEETFDSISKAYELMKNNDAVSCEYAQMLIEYKKDHSSARKILSDTLKRNPTFKRARILLDSISAEDES